MTFSGMSLTVGAAAAVALATAQAQTAAPPMEEVSPEEIIVSGIKDPYFISPKQLAGAVAEFNKWRPSLAPQARLLFRVGVLKGGNHDGLELTLRSGEQRIPLQMDQQHRFALPAVTGRWTLVANRPRGSLTILPLTLSPGTSDGDRRLGDLRLQCQVDWGFQRSETSIFARGIYSGAGGCSSKKFGYYVLADRSISAASVRSGSVAKPLQIVRGRSYRAPITEKLPDDARVSLTYR